MNRPYSRRKVATGLISLVGLIAMAFSPAVRGDDVTDARHIIEESVITIERVSEEMQPSPDMANLLRRAKGVLVVPNYYKAGFIFGGAYGDGVPPGNS